MAKPSHLSHVIITQTTKPHAACARNLSAHARKTDPGLTLLKSRFHHCGGLVNLHHCGGPVKLVPISLYQKIFRRCIFHHCESPVKPVWVSKGLRRQFSPLWRSSKVRAHQFEYQERSRNQVLPLLWSCETRARHLRCQERSWKQFSPQCRYCEACWCLFEFQNGPKKRFFTTFEVLWSSCTPVWGLG